MKVTVSSGQIGGTMPAVPSKSYAHRYLICAAFADGESVIRADRTSADIEATARCLRAMGSEISYSGGEYIVKPANIAGKGNNVFPVLDCGESGSTLRFLVPAVCALGGGTFVLSGRLAERPMGPLDDALAPHGSSVHREDNKLTYSGKLTGGEFAVAGDVSSQFISGLLMALPLCGGGRVRLTAPLASAPYVDITIDAMRSFGVQVIRGDGYYEVTAGQKYSPSDIAVPGDWSNAAFWLAAGVKVTGLDPADAQGDKALLGVLYAMGADASFGADGGCLVSGLDSLRGCEIDAGDIPDAVPVLAVLAATAKGTTRIYNAARLRAKESDRIESVSAMLTSFGAENRQTPDGILITGRAGRLCGCEVDSANDHRIAMAAAVGASYVDGAVVITGAEAVGKSYPDFWNDYQKLGGKIDVEHTGR